MRVCQPGPVAFHRAKVSGGRRREMDVRALPDFGRPRGLSILAAACLPYISGNTSGALRARAKVSFVQTGFSRSARSGLRLRFIPLYLTFVGLPKADNMRLSRPRREHQHVQSLCNQPECLKSAFSVVLSSIRDDQSGSKEIPRVAMLRAFKLMSTLIVYIRIYTNSSLERLRGPCVQSPALRRYPKNQSCVRRLDSVVR